MVVIGGFLGVIGEGIFTVGYAIQVTVGAAVGIIGVEVGQLGRKACGAMGPRAFYPFRAWSP